MKDIKVEMFALCQGAHNMDGHLTIVNTMDDFIVSRFPARLTFGLAIKLYVRAGVEGDRLLSISFIDKSGYQQSFPVIKTNLHIENLEKPSHINIALNLQNVLFEKAGTYDIHLEIDDRRLDDFAFEVIQKYEYDSGIAR